MIQNFNKKMAKICENGSNIGFYSRNLFKYLLNDAQFN